MKRQIRNILLTLGVIGIFTVSCKETFLERPPLGAISENAIANATGVEGSLIVAYRTLTGNNVAGWYTSPKNWLWGGIRSDDAYKGTEASDQGTEINPVERFEVLPNSPSVTNKWRAIYDGVGMANIVLRQLAQARDIPQAQATLITAQARFLRGFHHFEGKRCFNKLPYVDETIVSTEQYQSLTNEADIWPQIEADLKFAYDNLPNTWSQLGRVNKWAAGAFLAKALLYQKKYAEAKTIFDAIIANGVTNSGQRYGLQPDFKDVFRGEHENGREMIFTIQYTVGDGTGGANSNKDAELTNPHNDGPVGCCGFYQPSQTLVNAYRTEGGLPLIETFNTKDVRQHESHPNNFPDRDGPFDPRLDYTVGRVGIPYKDYGIARASWIRNLANGGPFLPNKHIQWRDEVGRFYVAGGWGQGQLGKNQIIMRYADLLLMAAECEVELNNLNRAREYVNLVRDRAAKSTVVRDGANPASNYQVSLYTQPWTNQAVARNAVRFERFLELAMEGHRFFDLVRWGIAEQTINAFFAKESKIRTHLAGARFRTGKDEYLPIPEFAILQSTIQGQPRLRQNPGY
ncbi:MAG: RagB/SusD family nutrient uptake outer membrane protein [Runella sp.]